VVARVEEEGTYVIAIESLSSSGDKFMIDNKINGKDRMRGVLQSPCIDM
jgi:hypothetical protein